MNARTTERFRARWEVGDVAGAVVAVDVIRAFTTAAYAFAGGARHIVLVDTVADALAYKAEHPGTLAMGEIHGRRPEGFDLSNSPVGAEAADLDGRTLVQRTSAGTRGVVAARSADRLWASSLVCASATAAAVRASGLGPPTYVITGLFEDQPDRPAADDVATAALIERAFRGEPLDAERTAAAVAGSKEAATTLALGEGHTHPDDIVYATRVDAFAFAMEVERTDGHLVLRTVEP
jgi:2-phosphosulfolactate phosphatase